MWAWPRSRDAYIFGIGPTIEHIFKITWARDFKFGKRLWIIIAIWLSGSAYYGLLWGSTVGYPSDSLASRQRLSSTRLQLQPKCHFQTLLPVWREYAPLHIYIIFPFWSATTPSLLIFVTQPNTSSRHSSLFGHRPAVTHRRLRRLQDTPSDRPTFRLGLVHGWWQVIVITIHC